ncbi:hypothetical protein FY528_09265 [Hymenobacter lutimineralis]|uniref:Uncharacterized protein n=1 Tax=Hymenobacter lutimineralis TaxID=2606448 RepID=A0A5D6V4I0_9BACT|nr:hypothetical protein [Hymenobacter lutimineralis]TYZ10045.1 hypothetical protein FY528_09265 [Hymenobacter lutimineralis]
MSLTKSLVRVALATALLLLIPLVAMQYTTEVNWTPSDFVFGGVVLFGAGFTFVLIARMGNNGTYRLGAGVAVLAGLLLVWANAAVGLVGSNDNPANLLYGAVLGVAVIGGVVTRFQPRGLSNAMFAAALTYLVVTAIAMFVWPPAPGTEEPSAYFVNVLVANGVFAALWAVAGLLFRRASNTDASSTPRLA